ncbi:MAG: hypothetical protein CVT48_04270 [Thermoplasmata archaeon HGW-Thermoplasmata-1]|nr:MAG: hypothetical protein CVT48_04270 [Thermoplasmata archaeon HGW-Thermoplasmata-1]
MAAGDVTQIIGNENIALVLVGLGLIVAAWVFQVYGNYVRKRKGVERRFVVFYAFGSALLALNGFLWGGEMGLIMGVFNSVATVLAAIVAWYVPVEKPSKEKLI